MSSFQLPLHDFYSGLKGKKAVSMSLMFSLTMKTIRGEYTYYRFEIRSKKKLLFSVFCRLYFNTKLLEDNTDKDENFWQCFLSINVTSTGTKNQPPFTFFFLFSLTKKSVREYTYYCPRRDFAQKAKSRGGTLVTRAYIKESTYSWNIQSYSQYRKNLDLLEQGPRGIGG